MVHHDGGEIVHVRLVLNIQVIDHIVTIPATDKIYDVIIDDGTEKPHVSGCAEGLLGNIIGS